MKLSDYVFDFLKSKNVSVVFMLPGGGAMHLNDSLGKSGIEYVCCLHEQAASIAAESYAQHTNEIGVVSVTSGPGATNAITGVTAGWIDSTPMLIISGQSKRADLVGDKKVRQIGSQEVRIIDMVKPITKYAVEIMDPDEIRYHMERAYYEAMNGRRGPVWLSIPLDVQAADVDIDNIKGFSAPSDDIKVISSEIQVAASRCAELLANSKKPLIIAGNGIKHSGSENRLKQLISEYKIPVQTSWKTIDMFDEHDDYYVGHPGIMGDRGANLILQECDLLISIGSRLDTSMTAFNDAHFACSARKVIVDIDVNEINRMQMDKDVAIACDAGVFLNMLIEECSKKISDINSQDSMTIRKDWIHYCHETRDKYPIITDVHRNEQDFVSAYYFIDRLCDLLRSDDVIVPESSGQAGEITYQAFRIKYGQKMKNAAGLGSMGFGLPYSIGACMANNRRRTILINGDGAFQMNIQELETVHRLGLPLKIFIWNNNGYGSIRSTQRNNFEGRYVASSNESGLSMPDTMAVASAYGFKTYSIRNNKELDILLPEILSDDEMTYCDLKVIPEETVSPRVKAYIDENGQIKSGLLENMWPFIEK